MEYVLMHEDSKRLHSLAMVLKDNGMPQETINMVLAAHCGLPMEKIDPKSPIFEWVDEPETAEAATDVTPENESREERFRRLRAKAFSIVEGVEWKEGLDVFISALNELSIPKGYTLTATLHPSYCQRRE